MQNLIPCAKHGLGVACCHSNQKRLNMPIVMKKNIVLASPILGSGQKTLADKLLSLGWYLLMMLKQLVYSPSAKHFFTLGKCRNTPSDGKVNHRNNTCGKTSTCLVFEVCGVIKNIFDILETD